jgi:UDP-N-acetylmuramoyl-L-alanyl-D-glutamate--2,6-diaminopimelate ligase
MTNPVTLSSLVGRGVPARHARGADVLVSDVFRDSRAVTKGSLFVAVRGESGDGTEYVNDAIARGAVAVMVPHELDVDVPQLVTDDPAFALGRAAELVHGEPTHALVCIGITGTNGKTTTTTLVEQALRTLGASPAVIGTGAFRFGDDEIPSVFTTPFGDDVARFARRVRERGATHLLMEVSSHGLDQRRVHAVHFQIVGFTNLSQDHLDYHPTMAAYAEAKGKLFTEFSPAFAVLNQDDPFAVTLAGVAKGRIVRCAKSLGVEVGVRAYETDARGIRAHVVTAEGEGVLESSLVGTHNLENLLIALGCLLSAGISLGDALRGLGAAPGAPGRLERVAHPGDVVVAVDYAHTPDAIAKVLVALRPATRGRLFIVFGCGGDRDRAKRPKMAEVAIAGADVVIVTSDNPRTEAPDAIIADILRGLDPALRIPVPALGDATRGFAVEPDRRAAIAATLRAARAGDTVLLAGKGHETYQIIGHDRHPFDDRVEARRVIDAIEGEQA